MFDRIAGTYDRVNSVLSFGGDARWRRLAAASTGLRPGGSALDIACGSGRLTFELAQLAGPSGRVVGLDFSAQMLAVARRSHPDLELVEGDALALPFPAAEFEAATMAFGLRNLADPERGLREMARVARRLVVLEFLRPPGGLVGFGYRAYLGGVLPRIGGWLSGDPAAYRYLAETVGGYRSPDELLELVTAAGWRSPRLRRLNLGTVALLSGSAV